MVKNDQLEQLLTIFSQLVSTKMNEAYGFELLECIIANFAPYVFASTINRIHL